MNLPIAPPGQVRVRADGDRLPPQGSRHIPGAPLPPRSCLDRGTRSPTTTPEMEALRRRVWRDQGVVSLQLEDITDPWLRQALTNEALRRWGPRNGGTNHGR